MDPVISHPYFQTFNRSFPEIKTEDQFNQWILPKNKKPIDATRFYIIRHGESQTGKEKRAGGGLDTDPLTENGKKKIAELALTDIDAVYCSPAKAAVETAEILGPNAHKIDSRLRQKHWGKFHGQIIDENEEYQKSRRDGEAETDLQKTAWEKLTFRFDKEDSPEETLMQVFDRTIELFSEISKDPELKGKNIAIVTHTPVLKVFSTVMSLLSQGTEISYHRHDFGNGGMVVMDFVPDHDPVLVDAKGVTFRAGSKY